MTKDSGHMKMFISGILFAAYIFPILQRNNSFIFHWFLPVLILEIIEESSGAGYVLSKKDILILRESLAPGKLRRNIYTNWVYLAISYSVSIITFRYLFFLNVSFQDGQDIVQSQQALLKGRSDE